MRRETLPGLGSCPQNITYPLPDSAHAQTTLTNTPDLPGFEGGFASPSAAACAAKCASLLGPDGWSRVACQAWIFQDTLSPVRKSWCFVKAGRGNAKGACGFTSAFCDNRVSPPSAWPCCVQGTNCENPRN